MDGALKTALNACLVGYDVSFDLRTLANDKLRSMNIGDNAAEDLQGALTDDVAGHSHAGTESGNHYRRRLAGDWRRVGVNPVSGAIEALIAFQI